MTFKKWEINYCNIVMSAILDKSNICAVFLTDNKYFPKFIYTCGQLLNNGKYKGDICLVVGDDLNEKMNKTQLEFIEKNNIIVKYFPNIKFSDDFLQSQQKMDRAGKGTHWFAKRFQFHKFHLFNVYFKKWNNIFYLDCGITINKDVSPMLELFEKNTLLAHSDAYPYYKWKLHDQFRSPTNTECFNKLNAKYNLNIDYCQTTIMLYDTNIIETDTYDMILNLLFEYPISITNDQGIIALYFTNIKPLFKQIKTKDEKSYFYDYLPRGVSRDKYIMLKS